MNATKHVGTFRMAGTITVAIAASHGKIWSLLTDSARFPTWNTTVERIEGDIAEGIRLAIRVAASPGRVFSPRVSNVEPARAMTWSDGFAPMFKGVRTFSLEANSDGTTQFAMREKFSGIMLPLKGSLPDFSPIFETYAADLKRAAEG